MNKAIIIAIVAAIVIIGAVAAFSGFDEQSLTEPTNESVDSTLDVEETEPEGRNFTLEFNESMGVSSP